MKIYDLMKLYTDGYKLGHFEQYPETTTRMYGYLGARNAKHMPDVGSDNRNDVLVYGINNMVRELNDIFDDFFKSDLKDMRSTFDNITAYLGDNNQVEDKIKSLHELGFLPLNIKALDEGTIVKVGVPYMTLNVTVDGFHWLFGFLEPLITSMTWKPVTAATLSLHFYRLADKFIKKTSDAAGFEKFQFHDFSARGMGSPEDGIRAGSSHLMMFNGTENYGAVEFVNQLYDTTGELVSATIPATEHTVACSNILTIQKKLGCSLEEAEKQFFIDYITNTYPEGMAGYVADTFHFWGFVENILTDKEVKDAINNRSGKVVIRPDSFDNVVEGIVGRINTSNTLTLDAYPVIHSKNFSLNWLDFKPFSHTFTKINISGGTKTESSYDIFGLKFNTKTDSDIMDELSKYKYFRVGDKIHDTKKYIELGSLSMRQPELSIVDVTYEDVGIIEALYSIYGGSVNSKGYKTLNPKISVIYGDGIDYQRAEQILTELEARGFATDCIVMGLGGGTLQLITRDSLAIAYKASMLVDSELGDIELYKDPKGGANKTSLKGYITVSNDNGYVVNQQQPADVESELKTIFNDGVFTGTFNLSEVRKRIADNM